MSTNYVHLPAHTQLNAMQQGVISSRGLLDLHLEQIQASTLNAVVTLDIEAAQRAADASDVRRARGAAVGALDGLPLTIKDSFETAGLRTTCGAEDLHHHIPERDADAVARLRHAGAVIMGKTNVPAYCQDLHTDNAIFGATRNPHDHTLTPGGSSGGAAAAVAAALTPLELGSDLAGSLRLPAHYCGVYALRPTQGLVPARGHIPRPPGWLTTSDMLTPGPLARHPRDLTLMLATLTTPAPDENTPWRLSLPDPPRQLDDFRIAIWPNDPGCPVDDATAATLEHVMCQLGATGAHITETPGPVGFAEASGLFEQLLYANAALGATDAAFTAEQTSACQLPTHDTSPRATALRYRTQAHRSWLIAREESARQRAAWMAFFEHRDVLITPAAPTQAIPNGSRTLHVDGEERSFFDQTSWANLISHLGLPAAIAPVSKNDKDLPIAVQIIGAPYADRTVLALAEQLATIAGATADVEG
ncbi:amidase family protein [Streptomyces neyagawaensis]|uniref:amidase family protein n=2 Tax=Streptomyces neyagawaensis TaxID=42238 RepID=UPI00201D1EC6|nr:amidase family protein [Streptomyces neyagawaensis]MCL6738927.1 amidase family protein [Streptomyces neyagawaensis]MDE1688372.1 amidase family protein [Streptomyces neyagawaensis]